MKKLALILLFLLIASCNPRATGNSVPSPRAIYIFQGQGELSLEELQAHPEVIAVQTFDDLKRHAAQKIALWIDKTVTPLNADEQDWINEPPQTYYPIVLVGTSNALYSIRDLLGICCFLGPMIEGKIEPGFSVMLRQKSPDPVTQPSYVPFLQGYDQKPTINSILAITDLLLEGRWKRVPTVQIIPVATATPQP